VEERSYRGLLGAAVYRHRLGRLNAIDNYFKKKFSLFLGYTPTSDLQRQPPPRTYLTPHSSLFLL